MLFFESTTFYFQTTRRFILVDFFRLGGREAVVITLFRGETYGATTRKGLVVAFLFELFVPLLAKTEQFPVFEASFQLKTTFFHFTSFLLVSRHHAF